MNLLFDLYNKREKNYMIEEGINIEEITEKEDSKKMNNEVNYSISDFLIQHPIWYLFFLVILLFIIIYFGRK